jgi:hypothetical protein
MFSNFLRIFSKVTADFWGFLKLCRTAHTVENSIVTPKRNEHEKIKSRWKTPKYSTLTPKKVRDSVLIPKKVDARQYAGGRR